MPDKILFARQPIFDKEQRLYAYELLFRHGEVAKAEFLDGDLATKSVLLNAYAENSAPQLLNEKPGFLNISRAMIPTLPAFARQFLTVEILEHEHGNPELVEDIHALSKRGFTVALDDFDMKNYRPELIDAVDIVKLDVLVYSKAELSSAVETLSQHKVLLLAEKVEDYQMLDLCRSLNFDLYQGFFFCRPELVRGRTLDTDRRALLELIQEFYQPDVSISAIADIVKNDPILSFKLLKLVNSSFYRRDQTVESIAHAVVLLGLEGVRSWVMLVTLGNITEKPHELRKESLMRALMCEHLGQHFDQAVAQSCFSAGVLSCLDAWLDCPIDELIEQLPLTPLLKTAILDHQGIVGQLLLLVNDFMQMRWQALTVARIEALQLTVQQVADAYGFAVINSDHLTER